MKVLVTGADGFLGKNLSAYLSQNKSITVQKFTRKDSLKILDSKIKDADFVFHFAGINRPENEIEFFQGNSDLTQNLCALIKDSGRKIPIVFSSSVQAGSHGSYGNSKRLAEQHLLSLRKQLGNQLHIFRLPNVFGKWCKPNYNSVVATFCYNAINNIPLEVHEPDRVISLVYIDDLVKQFLRLMEGDVGEKDIDGFEVIEDQYSLTIGGLSEKIQALQASRKRGYVESVGSGLTRALYATFVSYLHPEDFSYELKRNEDHRGVFIEVLKTNNSGQISYFTALPGVTRGGHYHHSKTEKFLVVKGQAQFRFRNISTEEEFVLDVNDLSATVVETIPGWAHDITNTGPDEMIAVLWSNEIFDPINHDTFSYDLLTKQLKK